MPCCRIGGRRHPENLDIFDWEELDAQDDEPDINGKHVWRVWEILGRAEQLVYPNTDVRIGDVFLAKIEEYLPSSEISRNIEDLDIWQDHNKGTKSPQTCLSTGNIGSGSKLISSATKVMLESMIYDDTLIDRLPPSRDARDHSSIRHEFHLAQTFRDFGIDMEKDMANHGAHICGFTGGKEQLTRRPTTKRFSLKHSMSDTMRHFTLRTPTHQDSVASKDRRLTLAFLDLPNLDPNLDPLDQRFLPSLFEDDTGKAPNLKHTEKDKRVFGAFLAYISVMAFRFNRRSQIYNIVEQFNCKRTRRYSHTEKLQLQLMFEAFEKTIAEIIGEKFFKKGRESMIIFLKSVYFKVTRALYGVHGAVTPATSVPIVDVSTDTTSKMETKTIGSSVDLTSLDKLQRKKSSSSV